ncbi:CCR4-NOT transcription complex subunit 6-like-B [Madurella mycetomatis]|uniref:CCR4-NOT transcription complex subunit 6-like-B n=1 Tax=Madurella mycetomatis TaxID=100816 RepID=A0A175VYV4_9PEZI|nr:CCR4-NOT transcription complex subunit 6-like-B [Madurella mycetomatis]
MAEEPTLPRLPPALPFGNRPKRARDAEVPSPDPSTSSDPAFFSSDDDPALDNYQCHGRRKRRYVGAWFDQQPASSDSAVGDETCPTYPPPRRNRPSEQPQKREFRRQLDSGVWMGTDGGLTDTDDCVDLDPVPPRLPLLPPAQAPVSPSPARSRLSPAENAAQNLILHCVDNGDEQVDLSDLQLETVSDGVLEPISTISPIPNVAKDVAFEQRDPEIKVFLFLNRLRTFPVALLNIEHLTVLSLRGNRLVTIPPGIARLKNLVALNIAQNKLRFLPGELLELLQKGSKLCELQFQPNLFWVPGTSPPDNWGEAEYERRTFFSRPGIEIEGSWTGLTTKLKSRTPVQFIDDTYNAQSRFTFPPLESSPRAALELEPFRELAVPKGVKPRSKEVAAKGAKSLFELAIRAGVSAGQADRIASLLREEGMPTHLAPAVEGAMEIHRSGGINCSVCGRETLVPLVRWIEFRQIGLTKVTGHGADEVSRFMGLVGESEGPVPFMRVGCSWQCVPVRAVEVPVDGGDDSDPSP